MSKKRKWFKEIYENEKYKIVFEEDDDAIFYALKDGDTIYFPININVYEKTRGEEKCISNYFVSWDKEVSKVVVNTFIRKFLENSIFRDTYFRDGEKITFTMEYADIDGINKECKKEIKKFNRIPVDKRKFKDYCDIKTHGIDIFSRMKLEPLMERLEESEIKAILTAFEDEKNVLNALKWCCRGLSCNDAIRKVRVDLEVAKNVRK